MIVFLNDEQLQDAIINGLDNYYTPLGEEPLKSSPLKKWIVTRELVRQEEGFLLDPYCYDKAIRKLLAQAIERLEQGPFRELGELLRLRYVELKTYKEIADYFHITIQALFSRRQRALQIMRNMIKEMEAEAIIRERLRIIKLKALLPTPTYAQLFGVDNYLRQVREGLNRADEKANLPLLITGLGGIGKTSLAIEGISRWLEQDLPWIDHLLFVKVDSPYVEKDHVSLVMDQIIFSLGQKLDLPLNQLPNQEIQIRRLAEYLALNPALIVIDNIETTHEVEATINLVRRIGNVAQIVITSRHEFNEDQLAVKPIILKELENAYALALLQAEAKRLGLEPLSEESTNKIFSEVGGHPLALKLIIGQLRKLPLSRILDGLERRSTISEKLYNHIYELSWGLLNQISQNILQGLILLPSTGAEWEWIVLAVEGGDIEADEHDIEQALQELSTLNLLQISTDRPPIYSLHQLTYHFLAWKSGLLQLGA